MRTHKLAANEIKINSELMGISDQSGFAILVFLMISSLCLEIIRRTSFSSPLASEYKINKNGLMGIRTPVAGSEGQQDILATL